MELDDSQIIGEFLRKEQNVFTAAQFQKYLKAHGVKIAKSQIIDLLRSSDFIFTLVNDEYITRAGVFTGRWFSFKPTKEEVSKGKFIIGHRGMPFVNPDISPDCIKVVANGLILPDESEVFSMNLAMDVFALYGEGYILPYILNDHSNNSTPLTSVQYSMPSEVNLTCWSLDKIATSGKFKYGDRILCRVVDWETSCIEMSVIDSSSKMTISQAAIEREEWYTDFENGLLQSFDRNGPASSIEEQLAFLFLENQEQLCIKNCGSAEEFLKHTKKIGFSPFGVENRIWRNGESVPYIGEWNKGLANELVMANMAMSFSPHILDAYLQNHISEELSGKKDLESVPQLVEKIVPSVFRMPAEERKVVVLNIEKRRAILKAEYNQFAERPIVAVRKRILELYSQVNELLCSIGCSGLTIESFPQQEMIILSQLFTHINRMLEEIENVFARDFFPVDEVQLSLTGMEDTFEDIGGSLYSALEEKRVSSFEMVDSSNKDE